MGIKVNVTSTPKNRISINKQDRTTIRAVGIVPPNQAKADEALSTAISAYGQANVGTQIAISAYNYANTLSVNNVTQLVQLTDVDATDVDNNETLVYDDVSGKFVVKEIPIINGGTF